MESREDKIVAAIKSWTNSSIVSIRGEKFQKRLRANGAELRLGCLGQTRRCAASRSSMDVMHENGSRCGISREKPTYGNRRHVTRAHGRRGRAIPPSRPGCAIAVPCGALHEIGDSAGNARAA